MQEFKFEFQNPMPEQPSIRFYTTGHCGGDAGHGGEAVLQLTMKDGGDGLTVLSETAGEQAQAENVESVSISVYGDWELDGMAICFLELGRALLARNDALKARAAWDSDDEEDS